MTHSGIILHYLRRDNPLFFRVDMNLQKETKLRTDLEAEKKANLELIAKLKTENQNGLEINEKVNLELEQEKRITERLKTEVDGWKDEANIYHNKLTSKLPMKNQVIL